MAANPPVQPTHLTPQPFSQPPTTQHHQRISRSPAQPTGSATQTLTSTPQRSLTPDEPLVLRLRGAHSPQLQHQSPDSATEEDSAEGSQTRQRRRPHIQWAEDVVDNEGLGRKKSKVCCIYHRPRAVGESSDESSSSDSDSSSSGDESDGARPAGVNRGPTRGRRGHGHDHDSEGGKNKKKRDPSPNDYEKMPRYDVKPLTQQPGKAT